MVKISFGSVQILDVIDEYASWKYQRHPLVAGAQRSLLIRFVKSQRLRDTSDITEKHIAFFVGGELSEFYSEQALKALRQFLWYCRRAGYVSIGHTTASRKALQSSEESSIVSETRPGPAWEPGVVNLKWRQQGRRGRVGLPTGKWFVRSTS